MGTTYGYVRVSARDQNEARQVLAMQELGITEDRMFLDKQSGKDFLRPQYQRMLRKVRPGDLIVVKSLDRLGRNYREILAQWQMITRKRGVDIMVMDMPLLDTRVGRDLTGTLLVDIVLELLSYVAETEREFIRRRQAEGIAAAKSRGVQFGRRPMERPAAYGEMLCQWKAGRISAREAARRLRISHKTFLRWVRE